MSLKDFPTLGTTICPKHSDTNPVLHMRKNTLTSPVQEAV